jgi:hypothetical protein
MHSLSRAPNLLLPVSLALLGLLGACAGALSPTAPSVVVPDKLRAPAGETLLRTLSAEGVQIYECRARTDDAGAAEWVFVAPEARLFDASHQGAGKHYGGPTWEAADGSKVVGTVLAKLDAPEPGSIPWLLLGTRSVGKAGAFSQVTSIQRVATAGGAAPATGCAPATIGQQARVPYTAQYVQYAKSF